MSKLRTVGFKSADELYKSISQSAREAADLRQLHENCTKDFKEAAGLQPVSNVKQVKYLLFYQYLFLNQGHEASVGKKNAN